MPLGQGYPQQDCAIARALEVVGDRWTLLVLRDCFLGVHRFADLVAHLDVPRAVLSDRLARLVEAGILERDPAGYRVTAAATSAVARAAGAGGLGRVRAAGRRGDGAPLRARRLPRRRGAGHRDRTGAAPTAGRCPGRPTWSCARRAGRTSRVVTTRSAAPSAHRTAC